jgi:hypothetical protein
MVAAVAVSALVTGSASVAAAGQSSPESRQVTTARIVVSTTSPAKVNSGAAVPLTVRLPKAAVGDTAVLQTRRPGVKKWQVVSKTAVPPSRIVNLSPRAAGGGSHAWRVRVRVAPEKVLTSNVVRVTAYAWYSLADLDTVTNTKNWYDFGTVAMGGKLYRNSVGASYSAASFGGWMSGEAEYNLSYRCLSSTHASGFRTTAARCRSGTSRPQSTARRPDHGWHGIGSTTEVTVDVTGGFRIELTNARLEGDPYQDYMANAAWGSARLYCAGKP